MSETKKRGPERGRHRAPQSQQVGFVITWTLTGETAHVRRLSRVLEAVGDRIGPIEVRTAYDQRMIAYRLLGYWFDDKGDPTDKTPDFWTPGSVAHERKEYPRR